MSIIEMFLVSGFISTAKGASIPQNVCLLKQESLFSAIFRSIEIINRISSDVSLNCVISGFLLRKVISSWVATASKRRRQLMLTCSWIRWLKFVWRCSSVRIRIAFLFFLMFSVVALRMWESERLFVLSIIE